VENPLARALIEGRFKPGQTVSVDSDPVGTTLVFSADGEAVVADAADRRDARRRDEVAEPVGGGAGSGRSGGRRRSVLDLPDTEPDRGDGGRPN
jgi:hypothetical protein